MTLISCIHCKNLEIHQRKYKFIPTVKYNYVRDLLQHIAQGNASYLILQNYI